MKYFFVDSGLFYYKEVLHTLSWLPTIWHPEQGFGASALVRLWYDYPIQLFIKFFTTIGFSWGVIDKLLWVLPVIIGVLSSWKLARGLSLSKISSYIASIIYGTNTYFLLLFGGGQLGVALGYGLAPYVLLKFIKMIDTNTADELKQGIWTGLWLALLVVFDLRLAYLIIVAAGLYYLLQMVRKFKCKEILHQLAAVFIIPGFIAISLHLFWILPVVMGGGGISGLGGEYTGPGMLKFLSFADFSHAISLLHPNWPENLFGKVYFMQPEFLILPILAFCALLFIDKKITGMGRKISFFVLLALVGTFLAKGVNEPLGGIFQWMFIHVPGFIMFRDPTKFYLYIAIAYSILIPYTIREIIQKNHIKGWVVITIFIVFWCVTIRPLLFRQLSGNFKPQVIPNEYMRLKDMLIADQTSSRTLWMPSVESFAYASPIHPSLSATDVFKNASISGLTSIASSAAFFPTIAKSGVKYIVVPLDVEGKLFMTDYKIDLTLRRNLIHSLESTSLKKHTEYQYLGVFENGQFSFRAEKPSIINRQQQLSIYGFVMSIVFLCVWIVSLIFLR
jgi:hypothetical protein